jgi:hypothetical protein
MGFSILPREEKFFTLFDRMAAKVVEGAERFRELIENYVDVAEKAKRIKEVEHEADVIAHEVMDKLNKSFITPMDREDIRSLVMYLDDVIDDIEATADKFALYDIKKPTPEAAEMVRIICRATEEIAKAVRSLEQPQNLNIFLVEINRLENQADQICREQLAKLFKSEPDVRELLKWKEVYEQLEACADRCEDVADVIEDIVVKNA